MLVKFWSLIYKDPIFTKVNHNEQSNANDGSNDNHNDNNNDPFYNHNNSLVGEGDLIVLFVFDLEVVGHYLELFFFRAISEDDKYFIFGNTTQRLEEELFIWGYIHRYPLLSHYFVAYRERETQKNWFLICVRDLQLSRLFSSSPLTCNSMFSELNVKLRNKHHRNWRSCNGFPKFKEN